MVSAFPHSDLTMILPTKFDLFATAMSYTGSVPGACTGSVIGSYAVSVKVSGVWFNSRNRASSDIVLVNWPTGARV